MNPEELKQPRCPRCGSKGQLAVKGGFNIWTCTLRPHGHGVIAKSPVTLRERAVAQAKALRSQQPTEAAPMQLTSVEQERVKAGLLPDGSKPADAATKASAEIAEKATAR